MLFQNTEHFMYNRFHKYVLQNRTLCLKPFGFQGGHSTDHAVIQLDNQKFEAFNNDPLYTEQVC